MGISLGKASESGRLLFFLIGRIRELFQVAGHFKLMPGHFLKGDGDAPKQGDKKEDKPEVEDN